MDEMFETVEEEILQAFSQEYLTAPEIEATIPGPTTTSVIVDPTGFGVTATWMESDVQAILDKYMFYLNNEKTHELIAADVESHFANTWTDYRIDNLTVTADGPNHVMISMDIDSNVTEQYNIDEYKVNFETDDSMMFIFLNDQYYQSPREIFRIEGDVVAALGVEEDIIESADDILFSAIKK